ncbi:hypothetical protein VAB18032_30249 (plasmid) [Micromonospora maris AB-18-032]|nr:hypothetical protein VAB18032_30249 [Micromonospora maris AB-18-032]
MVLQHSGQIIDLRLQPGGDVVGQALRVRRGHRYSGVVSHRSPM